MSSVVTVDQRVQSQWDMLKLHSAEMCRPESNIARHPSIISSSQPCQVNLSVKQEMSFETSINWHWNLEGEEEEGIGKWGEQPGGDQGMA